MSLAHDMPYPADADVLLRYGVLRQCAEAHEDSVAACRALPALCKPGVMNRVRDDLPALTGQSIVAGQRQSPWFNQLIWELTSGTLLRGLEANSGLQHLLPDPAFHQGGWLQTPAVPIAMQHPIWHLPAVLVLDLFFSENPVSVPLSSGGTMDVDSEGALLWPLSDEASHPAWPADCPVLRIVYYQGAGEVG